MHAADLPQFRSSLLAWFRDYRRTLPWRATRDPYRIWISEVMLQQTRVAAVIPYYERFLARFPDVRALAEAPEEEVLRLWSGLGYYSRARNLQKAAQRIVGQHAGQFPRKAEDVLALPGIGAYTAAAVLSIAFDEPLAVLDGNVARVIARLDALHGDLREPQRWRVLQARASALLASDEAGDWNQAMMELGATVCTPQNPQCLLCPASNFCEARKRGIADVIPEKRKKRAPVAVQLVTAVLLDPAGRCLLLPPPKVNRNAPSDDHVPSLVAGLWHFPTAPSPDGTGAALGDLLRRELKQKGAAKAEPIGRARHTVTYRTLHVAMFLVRMKSLPKIAGARYVALTKVTAQPISNLTRKIARNALRHLESTGKWRKNAKPHT